MVGTVHRESALFKRDRGRTVSGGSVGTDSWCWGCQARDEGMGLKGQWQTFC